MRNITTFLSLLIFFTSSFSLAQAQPKKKSAVAPLTTEQLIQQYRFDDAAVMLQREIEVAQRNGKDTGRLEADLQRANLGADMLRGTEQVVFIDSFCVGRSQVLETLRLSQEAGIIQSTDKLPETLVKYPLEFGNTAYYNDLDDRVYFAASDSTGGPKSIWSAYRNGKDWGTPFPLAGMQLAEIDEDYPFVMPDGITIYYAAQGKESLGGYDLFVTRYNAETHQYMKPETLGMPFNSPANDYMLAIDEAADLGWLVTDRCQPKDSVCIYVFIPSERREIYDMAVTDEATIRRAAAIASVQESQHGSEELVAKARQRLVALNNVKDERKRLQYRFVIDDRLVYTDYDQFHNETARSYAKQVMQISQQLETLYKRKDDLQFAVAQGDHSVHCLNSLQQIYKMIPELESQYKELSKKMRVCELYEFTHQQN